MAEEKIKIGDLDVAASLNMNDTFPVVQSGVTKRGLISQIIAADSRTAYVSSFEEFSTANADANIKNIVFSAGSFPLATNEINIVSGKSYVFRNTVLSHSDDTKKFISAVNKENFSILGALTIEGTRATTETNTTETGIYIDNCSNYIVENVSITKCKGYAIYKAALTGTVSVRGNKGRWTNIACYNNNYPLFIAPGSGAEYDLFINCFATGNAEAWTVFGGNHMFVGCNIVDNTKGVYLGPGPNHAHGSFLGCNINHNSTYNLFVEDVTLGENFNGCHFYGDSSGGLGKVILDNCRGIHITGGHLDAVVEVIDGASSGINYLAQNFIAGSYTSFTGDGVSKLVAKENYTASGPSSLNVLSSAYVEVNRSSPQSITSGDLLIYNAEQSDTLGSYDSSTGIFTAPYDGVYSVNLNAVFTGSGITASTSYIEVVKNVAVIGYLQLGLGGSIALLNETLEVRLAAGDTLRFATSSIGGSSLAMDTTGSFLKIRRID